MLTSNPTRLETVVSTLQRLIGLRFPKEKDNNPDLSTLTELYASQMFTAGNLLHRHIIRRTVPHVRVDETNLENIRGKMAAGTLVYITVNLGQLEYNVLNSICLEKNLPLAQFNNCLRTRRWFPLKKIRKSYRQRMEFLTAHRELPHPILSGYIKNLVLEGKSLLLSLDVTDASYLSTSIRNVLDLLIEAQKNSERPIYIIPEQLIWDKRPRREKASFFEALFGENEQPGQWKKLILFFRHYKKRAIARFGAPITLSDFLALESGEAAQKIYAKILGSMEIEKRTLTGPPIRPRSWFLERMFEDESLSKTLYAFAKEKNKPVTSVKRLAHRYAKEIAADVHYSNIEFGLAGVNWVFKNLFEGVLIDAEGLKNLKQVLSRGPTILVPNHRSHMDYLLLAHICYYNDIVVPTVAAGINLAFWPLGPFFRRCGAFFMRRTFTGNPIYKKVFQTYLKVLIQEGYLQEFFIEGGRSRTGKIKSPKLGMLSMYSEVMQEGAAPDIQFIPVSITYDRVLEQKSYLEEMEGKPKTQEKTRDLLKLAKFLKGRYGKIYVNFDAPISWQEVSSEIAEPDWAKKKPILVERLAQKICHAINRQVVVIPQALAASSLLITPIRGIATDHVELIFREMLSYLKWKQVKLSDTLLKIPEGAFLEAIHQFESAGLIKRHMGLEESFFEIPTDKRMELDFFKNSSIHYFVSLSLWCGLLLTRKAEHFAMKNLVDEFAYFQQIFLYEFRFSTRRSLEEHLDKLCCYLQEKKLMEYNGGEIHLLKEGRPLLKDFSMLIKNYVEAYRLVWETYLLRPTHPDDAKTLTKAILTHGKHQLMLGGIQYPEAISQSIFENAIQSFRMLGYFSSDSEAAKKLLGELEKLLSENR